MRTTVKRLWPMAVFSAASIFGNAWAQPQTTAETGLGQSWPHTFDISASPHWHVYAFENGGIRYIQINDLNGTVRGAFASANGQFLVLPMGLDSQQISTPQQSIGLPSIVTGTVWTEVVYQDTSVVITVTLSTHGTIIWDICEPAECSTHKPS
ncbi:hypothetical protein [Dyella silvatica]|uniref:hypothetical protein n=1 Tax=Dyella silvatica TaxID=2992128 RepID=UPI0022545F98|nr:hypothetical protein [Dyella silvatica]